MTLTRKGIGIKTYWFWTNFSRTKNEFGDFEVYDHDPKFCEHHHDDSNNFWAFHTTLDLEYMNSRMLIKDMRTFLFKMLDIYGRVNATSS